MNVHSTIYSFSLGQGDWFVRNPPDHNKSGRRAGAVVRTIVPESVTPFVHGVIPSVQGVIIKQQQVTLERHFCGSYTT